jgi:(p)ppGpp synthase/HD superfamily hydrolase
MTDYLVALGTDKVPHSNTPFLAHLIGVYRDLKEWDCPEYLAVAGLFHSIYGTEMFQRFSLPLSKRDEIRELIGEHSERIAYANCALTRVSMDGSVAAGGPPRLWDRFQDCPLEIADEDFHDLVTLHLCDRLEQVERTGNWDLRREAWGHMAHRLGGIALESYERVFAGH